MCLLLPNVFTQTFENQKHTEYLTIDSQIFVVYSLGKTISTYLHLLLDMFTSWWKSWGSCCPFHTGKSCVCVVGLRLQ